MRALACGRYAGGLLALGVGSMVVVGAARAEAWRAPRNLDFENGVASDGQPVGWDHPDHRPRTRGDLYAIGVDDAVAHGGRASARVEGAPGADADADAFGTVTQAIDAAPFHGQRIRLSGFLKTDSVVGVGSGLWMRIDGHGTTLAFDNMQDRAITGTTDWARYEVVHDVPDVATRIAFGVLLHASGTVWADDLVIDVVGDDVAVTSTSLASPEDLLPHRTDAPDPVAIGWLSDHAVAFDHVTAERDLDELEPFGDMIGDARIVGLGEPTHGSREVFQMKHRLLEFLVERKGFTIFSIEASTPEAYRLNDYVRGEPGDPKALIGGMYFWTWNTEEVLAMVEWMREANATRDVPLQFTGFDMQTPTVAGDIVVSFLRETDPGRAERVSELYERAYAAGRSGAGFASATATFPVEDARGKHLRLSGLIRTELAESAWAAMWWRCDGESGPLAFDNMQARAPRGTTAWTPYVIELEVPDETIDINFGCLVSGSGRAWFDDLRIELDGEAVADSDSLELGFDGPELRGFSLRADGYHAELSDEAAGRGGGSLLISRVAPEPEAVSVSEVAALVTALTAS